MPLNFYQILGVPPIVDDAGLKLAFRQFAKQHHPDRPGVGTAGTELFMLVRNAFEALKDPTVRFAYDRYHSILCMHVPLVETNSQVWTCSVILERLHFPR